MQHLRLLKYCLLLLSFFFISCKHVTSSHRQINTPKKLLAIKNSATHQFAAPKVTFIGPRNQPKKVTAGRPVRKANSLRLGNPFFTNYGTDQGLPINNIIGIGA
jgi:hypothetical protein